MRNADAARISDEAIDGSLPARPSWKSAKSMIEAKPARMAAPPHVGSAKRRCSRASVEDALRNSSWVGLRPVRPRASIEPAALPRCLVRRLRFVCAMWPRNLVRPAAQQGLDRRGHAQLDVLGPAGERRLGRGRDQLGGTDLVLGADARQDV